MRNEQNDSQNKYKIEKIDQYTDFIHFGGPHFKLEVRILSKANASVRTLLNKMVMKALIDVGLYIRATETRGATDSYSLPSFSPHRIGRVSLRDALPISTEKDGLGYIIRLERLMLKWSQRELAMASGISRPHVSDLERSKYFPHALTLMKVLQAIEKEKSTRLGQELDPILQKTLKDLLKENKFLQNPTTA